MNNFNRFTLIFSGLCHNVNPTGKTNLFEMNRKSKLAILYQENLVRFNWKQYHIATGIILELFAGQLHDSRYDLEHSLHDISHTSC